MTGTLIIKKTAKNQQYYYVNLSYKDPYTGQWKIKTVSTGLQVKNNKRRAENMIQSFLEKFSYLESEALSDAGIDPDILLCDYIDLWLKGKKCEVKKSTYEGYSARIRSIRKYFEPRKLKLRSVTPRDLDVYFKWCLRYGKRNQKTGEGEPLSVRGTRSYKSILYAVFCQAIIDGLIKVNPVVHIRVHGKKNRDYADDLLFLTREETAELIHFLEETDPRFTPMAFMAAYYGFRRSELLGLKWDAVDFKNHRITVRRTVVRVSTVDEGETTKTPAGKRTLSLFPTAERCLLKLRREQEENAAFFGNTYKNKAGYIFTWEDGSQYDPNYITRTFSKLTKQFGRPEITLHKLRHTCVSLLAEMGWDLKKIQYWCGHKDCSTTANIYMHFNRQRLNDSAEDLARIAADCDDLFGGKPVWKVVGGSKKTACESRTSAKALVS